jgi:hypothetical protein
MLCGGRNWARAAARRSRPDRRPAVKRPHRPASLAPVRQIRHPGYGASSAKTTSRSEKVSGTRHLKSTNSSWDEDAFRPTKSRRDDRGLWKTLHSYWLCGVSHAFVRELSPCSQPRNVGRFSLCRPRPGLLASARRRPPIAEAMGYSRVSLRGQNSATHDLYSCLESLGEEE